MSSPERQAETWLAKLSWKQKIGQVFMARGLHLFPGETRDLLRSGAIGNLQARSNEDAAAELAALREEAPLPLLIGADMENGFAGTGFGGTPMPCQISLGAVASKDAAYQWAAAAAREARAYGVNMVFGPVLDLALEPRSPMVNIRSFGALPEQVAPLAAAAVRGYQEQGLQVAAKHYPGVGRSPVDNHIEEVVLPCDAEAFEALELRLYRDVFHHAGLGGVMSGHARVPAVDPDNLSTTSPLLVQALRATGFDGILMTDSLAMQGIKTLLAPETLLPAAFLAGHDLLLGDYAIPPGRQLAWLRRALECHPQGPQRLEAAVRRILRAKARLLTKPPPPDVAVHQRLSRDLSRRALTLQGDRDALAATTEDTLFILAGAGREDEGGHEIGQDMVSGMAALLRKTFPDRHLVCIDETPGAAQVEGALNTALRYRRVIYVAHALPRSYKGTADLPEPQRALISGLRDRLAVLVLLGNPWAARLLPPLRAILYAYWGGDAEGAVIDALSGAVQPRGSLPITRA